MRRDSISAKLYLGLRALFTGARPERVHLAEQCLRIPPGGVRLVQVDGGHFDREARRGAHSRSAAAHFGATFLIWQVDRLAPQPLLLGTLKG